MKKKWGFTAERMEKSEDWCGKRSVQDEMKIEVIRERSGGEGMEDGG